MAWSESLSVGVPLIDEQHKTWFEKADLLFEAGRNARAREFIAELLEFLDAYTKKHFADEERYMQSIDYPGYPLQKKAHTEFIAQLARLKEEYKASGGNLLVIMNANQMVLNWLTNHISTMDRKIGEYAKTLKK